MSQAALKNLYCAQPEIWVASNLSCNWDSNKFTTQLSIAKKTVNVLISYQHRQKASKQQCWHKTRTLTNFLSAFYERKIIHEKKVWKTYISWAQSRYGSHCNGNRMKTSILYCDLFNLHWFKDGPVNGDKARTDVGAEVGEVAASSLKDWLLEVVGWMNEGTSKALDRAEKTSG